MHHGNVVGKIHSTSPSLLLPQNWTISAKNCCPDCLGCGSKFMACNSTEIVLKTALCRGGKKEMKICAYVNAYFPQWFIRPAHKLFLLFCLLALKIGCYGDLAQANNTAITVDSNMCLCVLPRVSVYAFA